MTSSSSNPIHLDDPLARAVDAEHRLWDFTQPHNIQWLAIRDDAVGAASAAGHTREEIAGALGVLPADVDRILFKQQMHESPLP